MRRIALGLYLLTVWGLFYLTCITPQHVLAVQYSRVMTLAARTAVTTANRMTIINLVASNAALTSPASIAVRAVAGPIGWAALGLSAGVMLHQYYYSPEQQVAMKEMTPPAGSVTIHTTNVGELTLPHVSHPGAAYRPLGSAKVATCDSMHSGTGHTHDWAIGPFHTEGGSWWPTFPGSEPVFDASGTPPYTVLVCHVQGQPQPTRDGVGAPTAAAIAAAVAALSSSSPLAPEMNTQIGGTSGTPTDADVEASVPLTTAQAPTIIKPTSEVLPTDTKLTETGEAPVDPQQTSAAQKTTEDGVEKESTATVICDAGTCDDRTIEGIFETHKAAWLSSGFLSILGVISDLTWPTELPVYTFDLAHTGFGVHTLDMGEYEGTFVILRSLVIFFAVWVGYRLILG